MSSYGVSDRWMMMVGGVFLGLGPTVKASLAYPRLSLDGGFCPSIQGIHTYTVQILHI